MSKRKILVVDDEEDIRNMIKSYLESNEYLVLSAEDCKEALNLISENDIDLIILDIMIPGLDGISFCQNIREKISCPIIFLSAKTLEEDIIRALSVGGDDYITKPFSLRELKIRIETHIRREERFKRKKNCLVRSGNVVIDMSSKEVFCKGNKLSLTKKEYEVIELLILNKSIIYSREKIFERVWGYDSESDLSAVTEVIKNIRKKLKEFDKERTYIQTVYGLGYKWEVSYERE